MAADDLANWTRGLLLKKPGPQSTGMVATMISQASRWFGSLIERVLTEPTKPPTIRAHWRRSWSKSTMAVPTLNPTRKSERLLVGPRVDEVVPAEQG